MAELVTKISTAFQARQAAAIGDAARKRTSTTTVGSGAGGGGTDKDKGRSWQEIAREKSEAAIAARAAKR